MNNPRRLARTLCFASAILTVSGAAVGLTATAASATNSVTPGSQISANNTPYSTGQKCDPGRDGYHFIMNQLDYPAGSTIDGSDFGPINITFSNGSIATATFTDLSGGNTAHFLNNTVNQTGNFTITSATMTIPAGSNITGYGNLVISHPPCGTLSTVDPTTTVAATDTPTTTVAGTDTPTTLVASQTPVVPTTTTPNLGVVAPSLLPTTATGQVASQGPVAPVSLPSTGRASGQVAILGLAAFGLGLTLIGLTRRARPFSS